MKVPFVWRKTAQDEVQVWKGEAARQRRRADRAEAGLKTEVSARRRVAEMYSDLLDEHERAFGALLAAPGASASGSGFDKERARRGAERIAELRRGAAVGRAEAATPAEPTAEEARS